MSFTLAAEILELLQLPFSTERYVKVSYVYFMKTMSVCSGWYFWHWAVKEWLEHVWSVCVCVRKVLLTSRLFHAAPWRQLCSPWETTWCREVTIAPSRCGTWRTWDLRLLPSAQTQLLIGKSSRLVRCKTASWDCCFWTSRDNTVLVLESSGKLRNFIPLYKDILKESSQVRLLN